MWLRVPCLHRAVGFRARCNLSAHWLFPEQELEEQARQAAASLRGLALRQEETLAGLLAATASAPVEAQLRALREENAALQVRARARLLCAHCT